MHLLVPKIKYLKGHNLVRFRGRDEKGTLWRRMTWEDKSQKVVIKSDRIDPNYSSSWLCIPVWCNE